MKKTILIIVLVLVVAIAAVIGFFAYKNSQSIVGQWETTQDGITVLFEFNDSGSVRMSAKDSNGKSAGLETAQYTYSDKTVTIIAEGGGSISGTVSGKKMTINYNGDTVTLTQTSNYVYTW